MRFADLTIVIAMIAIVVMMIIPLNSGILDILLIFNITLSLTVLLTAIYTEDTLEFSALPSLLLILTLFRLALNVSTTRLILLDGYAGQVIQSFGNFVIREDVLVGFVIFLILVIIQFVVITKGAERVSEVGARFTLDAMPGKQMSIDADLNAGLITDEQARERRQRIQQEADFYGSMDGASKFVKGDAIASIIITLINVIGGLIRGIAQEGDTFAEALQSYTLLTVGDGLVSQIPALLISTATGLVVTRSASGTNLGEDVAAQLTQHPKVIYLGSGLMAFLGIIPGLPIIPFFTIAGGLGYFGYKLTNFSQVQLNKDKQLEELSVKEEQRKPGNVLGLLKVDKLGLELGFGLLPLAEGVNNDLSERINVVRRQLALELGLVVPVIRVRDNIQLDPSTYSIKLRGVEVATGELNIDKLLAMNPGIATGELPGIDTVEPAFGLPAKWVSDDLREKAEIQGYTVVDPPTVLTTHITEVIRNHAGELLGRQGVQDMVELVKESNPTVVNELIPDLLSLGKVQKILLNLLNEQVSIRNFETILETLADFSPITSDTDMLTEYVRQALAREIVQQYVPLKEVMFVATLGPELEQLIIDSVNKKDGSSYISIDPNKAQSILEQVKNLSTLMIDRGQTPIILSSPGVRLYFRRLLEGSLDQIAVLSYNELHPEQNVQTVGVVNSP